MAAFIYHLAVIIILSFPLLLAVGPVVVATDPVIKLSFLAISAVTFSLTFILTAGGFSRFGISGIKKGKFPRDARHPVYSKRRVYGFCWTALYYFKPLYWLVLSQGWLKHLTFRLYGYSKGTNFTIYPDCWVRDLPLLDIGEKAYLANRSTIGTNLCLKDGTILVDGIRVEESGLVGHLVMLAPGTKVGKGAEIGAGAAIGIRVRLGEGAKVGPSAAINHGVTVGAGATVGPASYLGVRVIIRPNVNLPGGSNIPSGHIIESDEKALEFFEKESKGLQHKLEQSLSLVFGEPEAS